MKNIVSTYHHSFAGGSKNTSRLLHQLSDEANINAYFLETPQYFTYTKSKVKIHTLTDKIQSDVMKVDYLENFLLTEKIICGSSSFENLVLFGANLFPYCHVLLEAKRHLKFTGKSAPKLVVHPVGSDIWQIGPALSSHVKLMLEHPDVDRVVTYSKAFVDEIRNYYSINRDIEILPPMVETAVFQPITNVDKAIRRLSSGFLEDDFIIHHHSSMRRIKCPEIVIDIALKASQVISKNCILIMTGPLPDVNYLIANYGLSLSISHPGYLYSAQKHNLTIHWTGILHDVEKLIQISDVELNASLHDSFNISLMEAMACGIPVVTSSVVGIAEHVIKSEGGFCFDTTKIGLSDLNKILDSTEDKRHLFEIDSAVAIIEYIAYHEENALETGQRASRYVHSKFSPGVIKEKFYDCIN